MKDLPCGAGGNFAALSIHCLEGSKHLASPAGQIDFRKIAFDMPPAEIEG
jgi:hypothetical protein